MNVRIKKQQNKNINNNKNFYIYNPDINTGKTAAYILNEKNPITLQIFRPKEYQEYIKTKKDKIAIIGFVDFYVDIDEKKYFKIQTENKELSVPIHKVKNKKYIVGYINLGLGKYLAIETDSIVKKFFKIFSIKENKKKSRKNERRIY